MEPKRERQIINADEVGRLEDVLQFAAQEQGEAQHSGSVASKQGTANNARNEICNVCGSKLVYIRGKHPKEPQRYLCACCLVEKLEDIISNISHNEGCCKLTPVA